MSFDIDSPKTYISNETTINIHETYPQKKKKNDNKLLNMLLIRNDFDIDPFG